MPLINKDDKHFNCNPPTCWTCSFNVNNHTNVQSKAISLVNWYEMTEDMSIGINSMPDEIREQIIRGIPAIDLPNVILANHTFCRQARPYLYQCIRYIDEPFPSDEREVVSVRHHARVFDHQYCARVVRLGEFQRSITENPALVWFIKQASFSWIGTGNKTEADALRLCFRTIKPSNLSVSLPYKYALLARMSTVTSLDLIYPSEGTSPRLQYSLRRRLYSIFIIDSLRNLTLRCARSWCAFGPLMDPDKVRARISNVISLSLPDTVPMDIELAEILTCTCFMRVFHYHILSLRLVWS